VSSRDLFAVSPCGLFVIALLAAEAAVQDADEAVAQGAQGLVVGVAGGAARSPGPSPPRCATG
jgi:hypothetical protein